MQILEECLVFGDHCYLDVLSSLFSSTTMIRSWVMFSLPTILLFLLLDRGIILLHHWQASIRRFHIIKGQCHAIFYPFIFSLKHSTWAPYEQAKPVSRTFSCSRRYSIGKFEILVSSLLTTYTILASATSPLIFKCSNY